MIFFLIQHTVFWVVYGLSAWAVGEAFLSLLAGWERRASPTGVEIFGSCAERAPIALACGLGWIGQGLYLLGVTGLLSRPWMAVFGLALVLASRGSWVTARSALRWVEVRWTVGIGALMGIGPLLSPALYPPTSFDGGMYHLPFAERFLEAGALVLMPELRYPIFPQGAEMHFLPAMACVGDVAAKLTQTWPLLGTGILLWSLGKRFFSARVGWWAAALWLGTPVVVRVGTQTYVDASLAFHVTAAFGAWLCWERAEPAVKRLWMVLCGLQLGFAASVKYSALFFVLIVGPAIVWVTVRSLDSRRLRAGFVAIGLSAAAFTLVAGPWYGRIAWHTENPVFPFYTQIFGDNAWRHSHDGPVDTGKDKREEGAAVEGGTVASEGGLDGLRGLVRVPWDSWMQRARFQLQAPLSPFFVPLVPWLIWIAAFSPVGRRCLVLSLAFALFWTTTEQDLRILIPILPVTSLAAAAAVDRIFCRLPLHSGRRLSALALALLFLAPGWLFALYKSVSRGPLPTDDSARTAYLSREVPGFAELDGLQRAYGDDIGVYVFYGEHLHYFSTGRRLGDWFGPEKYDRLLEVAVDAAALHRELASLEMDFLMVRRPWPGDLPQRDEDFRGFFEEIDGPAGATYDVYRLRPL